MRDWHFVDENYMCSVRTVGVLVREGKILVQRERSGNEYALPGGHVMIGETIEEGIVREYMEETGEEVRVKKLLWTEECFWEWKGRKAHNIAFYYLIELCDRYALSSLSEIVAHKDNDSILLEWIPIDCLSKITIYPSFIRQEINCLNGEAKHFISRV